MLERNADVHFALRTGKLPVGPNIVSPMSGLDLVPFETTRSALHIEEWPQEDDMAEAKPLIFDSRSLGLKACFSKLEKK